MSYINNIDSEKKGKINLTKSDWYFKKIQSKLKSRLGIKCKKDNFGGRQYYFPDVVIDKMCRMLESGIPFSVGRMGMVELNWLIEEEQKDDLGKVLFSRKYDDDWSSVEKNRRQFVEITRDAYKDIDILANWYNCSLEEDILIRKYTKKSLISTDTMIINSFMQNKPWTKYLQGKKVLVISPFVDEIKQQYMVREKLFDNPNILPEFELKIYKGIWIQDYIEKYRCAYRDVYNKYLEDIFQIDFDVALISCSAPSFALASEIKKKGRTGIQMGGALQILFGIKGKRWDEMNEINCLYNEHWIRPGNNNRPRNAEVLDGCCYW